MKITLDRKPNCIAEAHVEVPSDDVAAKRKTLINRYQQLARVPGYRPGKTPAQVIAKRFESQILGELSEQLARTAAASARDEHKLDVLSINQVSDLVFQDDGAVTFTLSFTLAPELELPEYKGISVRAPAAEVTEEMLSHRMEELRSQLAQYPKIEDRPVAEGDIAVVDLNATVDGAVLEEAFPENGTRFSGLKDFWLEITPDSFLPGLAPQLKGMAVGETREGLSVTIAEDSPHEALRGRTLVYSATLNGIRVRELPELNDEFAASIAPGNTLEDLKGLLRQRLAADLAERRRSIILDQVVAHLDQLTPGELPEDALRGETQWRVDQMVNNAQRQGLSDEELIARQEEIFTAAARQARLTLKLSFLVSKIADKEKLNVENVELAARVSEIAEREGVPMKKYLKQLEKNNGLQRIRSQILHSKVLDFLAGHANVTEIDPSAPAPQA